MHGAPTLRPILEERSHLAIDITLIRHGETEGNAGDVWQGHGDSALTPLGRRQAADLGRRMAGRSFDRVVASDLGRVLDTARRAGLDPEPMKEWREVDLGRWEGLSRVSVVERFPDEVAALAAGDDVPLGGGERWSEFGERIDTALDALVEGADDGDRIAVVAHGGVVHAVVAGTLGFRGRRRPWPVGPASNTSITRLHVDDGSRTIRVFNDASHTETAAGPAEGATLALIRHGESEGNVRGTWQGITDGALTDRGRRQADDLAAWYRRPTALYASRLRRARDTAAALGRRVGADPVIRDDVVEMSFGAWEDLTTEEIVARDGAAFAAAFEHDHPRGGDGETFAGVAERMRSALGEIAEGHAGETVGVVSHGGAIRAFAATAAGLSHATRNRIAIPDNASVSHVRFGADGPVIEDYNTPGG